MLYQHLQWTQVGQLTLNRTESQKFTKKYTTRDKETYLTD
jgi:hypothetical protein